MAERQWKLRKDKLQEGAPQEGAGEPIVGTPSDTQAAPSPAFSLNDTAVEELEFMPSAPETPAPPFHALDLAGGDPHGHDAPEEPHFSDAAPPPHDSPLAPPPPLEPAFADDTPPFSPFVPYQPEPTPPAPAFLGRDEVAPGLASQSEEDGIPRVAPFIVDVPPAAEQAAHTGALVVRIGNLSANFTLLKETTTIGRPDSVTQSYPDIEIELDDAVSRRHAEIRQRDGDYYLVDLMSTNGTLLNGQRVPGDQELRLLPGDRIRMGDRTEIVFE